MDFDVPTDLIRQAQIGFREDVGLSSFDSKDTTLPSLPTVEESISALDRSLPYLRCKYCTGKLLRGLQSLICIYCGQYQKKDLNPDPISFKSSNGYRWLLQSLNLNGSERVGSLADGCGMNGGQSPAEDEITLSELMDLHISWRDEPEKAKPKSSFDNKTFEHTRSSINYNPADLDSFFTGSERAVESALSQEQPVTSKNNHIKDSGDQENLTFFQNVLPPETHVMPSIDVSGDASSGWNAEFQSADSKKTNENSKVDPFVGAEVDLSAHMDSVFGQVEDLNNRTLNDDSHPHLSKGDDLIQDDLFANLSSENFQQTKQFDSVAQAKDGLSDNLHNASSEGVYVDWFENTDWQKNAVSSSPSSSLAADPIQNDLLNNAGPQTSQHADKLDFGDSNKHYSDPADWFQDSQWQVKTSTAPNLAASQNDDDSFDEWNDFTSSTGDKDSLQDSWKQSSNKNAAASEKTSEVSLFPSVTNPEEVDFGSFLQSDLFSGSATDKNPNDTRAGYDIFSEVSTVNRSRDNNAEAAEKEGGAVETLLSQMHDLSFMLKSELSIPSKSSDDIGGPPPHS